MTPVFQTQFVAEHGKGNCVQACIASMLDLSLDEVPAFRDAPCLTHAIDEFLASRGLRRLGVIFGGAYEWGTAAFEDVYGTRVGGGPVLMFGQSPRSDTGHAIVGEMVGRYNWRLVHDPYPGGTGIAGDPKSIHWIVKV